MAAPLPRIVDRSKELEWEIPNYLSLKPPYIHSDAFSFRDDDWYIKLVIKTFQYYVVRKKSSTKCSLQCSVGVKKVDGRIENLVDGEILNFDIDALYASTNTSFFSTDALKQRRAELLPSGVLTLVFKLQFRDLETETASPGYLPSSCVRSACSVEASTQTSENCIEKLSDDLKDLMLSADESDFTVKVRGDEFRLHRCILGARTPVFKSMLTHEMKEKATGFVCIDDCEPDTFRAFVRYMYSGRVDELSSDTVFGLYTLVDKYQVEDLKCACLGFIERILSVDTFCDVVTMAMTYGLTDLLDQATDYFSQNTIGIIQTAKWRNFVKEQPI